MINRHRILFRTHTYSLIRFIRIFRHKTRQSSHTTSKQKRLSNVQIFRRICVAQITDSVHISFAKIYFMFIYNTLNWSSSFARARVPRIHQNSSIPSIIIWIVLARFFFAFLIRFLKKLFFTIVCCYCYFSITFNGDEVFIVYSIEFRRSSRQAHSGLLESVWIKKNLGKKFVWSISNSSDTCSLFGR